MHIFSNLSFWVALSSIYLVVVSQTLDSSVDCSDNTVNITPLCWSKLNVSGYLSDWWERNEESCNSPTYQGSGFASCFLQKLQQNNYPGCSNISAFGCPAPSHDHNINLQGYYIWSSIYNIHAWYTSMYQSIEAGDLFADQVVNQIVEEINPVLPGDTSLGVLLSALSAGFAFLSIPAGSVGGVSSQVVSTAIGQAPGLIKTLLPTGSLHSELKQIGEIEANLASVTQQFQANLASTLNATVSDFTNFMQLSRNGAFIGGVPSLESFTSNITRVLKTFVVSQALQANNIIITVARNMSVYDLYHRDPSIWGNQTVYSGNKWRINCQYPPDENGVCDNWWIDPATHDSYALFNLGHMEDNYFDLMNTMFTKGWTTGSDLFLGSNACSSKTLAFEDAYLYNLFFPTLDTNTLIGECFVSLRVCTWNQTNNPAVKNGYEFESSAGCGFAWPNICVNNSGFHVDNTLNASEAAIKLTHSGWAGRNFYNEQNAGFALITKELGLDSSYSNYYDYNFYDSIFLLGIPQTYYPDDGVDLLGYNSLYDVINIPIGTLQQQATSMDEQLCQQLPQGSDRPGWGGAGYKKKNKDCDKVPASYLGPGLYFDAAFCGPGDN